MQRRTFLCATAYMTGVLVFGLVVSSNCELATGQDSPRTAPEASAFNPLSQLGDLAETAKDLRAAAEALERFGNSLDGFSEKMAGSVAKMSSEFDPFGYKTAFRTISRQMEVIHEQNELIRNLQQNEIRRLKKRQRRNRKRAKSEDG